MVAKRIFTLLFSLIVIFTYSQENLNAFFYSSPFYTPEHGPYIETYMAIVGESVNFIETEHDKLVQATIEITMLFKQNKEIKDFRKYNLKSPIVTDTIEFKPNFIDMQRIPLEKGIYSFELIVRDINDSTGYKFIYHDILTIEFNDTNVNISGIQLVESYKKTKKQNLYSKNGYDLIPFVSDFFPNTVMNLIFYAEVYNMDKIVGLDEAYLLKYYIEGFNTNKVLHEFSHFRKQLASQVNVIFENMDIEKLPSGNFNLVIEIRDKNNKLLKDKKYFFQRSNPGMEYSLSDLPSIDISNSFVLNITNTESIKEYIRSLRPISDELERTFADNQLKAGNLKLMQQFFLNFWEKRNMSNPKGEWEYYLEQVIHVNNSFSTQIMKGYETDRGRIYLQYGTPNTITDKKFEMQYYPYQIWHYYQTQGQTNRKFVFYKPGLAVNDFQLIHSNARGEISNKNWGKFLIKDFSTNNDDLKQQGGVYDDFDFIR